MSLDKETMSHHQKEDNQKEEKLLQDHLSGSRSNKQSGTSILKL